MDNDENEKRIYGPILPSTVKLIPENNESNNEYFGPQLPPHLLERQKQQQEKEAEEENDHDSNFNEGKTSDDENIKNDHIVGPLPPSALDGDSNIKTTQQQKELEERALEIKIKGIDQQASTSKDEKFREEWMTELPDLNKSGLGIFARQFRKRDGPDMSDRSIWTDTPNSVNKKPKKTSETIIEKTKFDCEKDKEQDEVIKKHKKKHKRNKSLMELHAKKLKKEKKKKDKEKDRLKVVERRPFNREEDLQVNRFDQARKQAIIKKAQTLDTKFSSGKSKYL